MGLRVATEVRKKEKTVCVGLSFPVRPPPLPRLKARGMSGKLGELISSQRAHLGDNPGIHLFAATSWTD